MSERSHFNVQYPLLVLPLFLLLLLLKDFGCCFSLVTVGVTMRYSDIKKCCNSTRPKAPCLEVQSCCRACYRASEIESLIIERLICSCGSTSTLVQTSPISEVSGLRTPSCLCATNPPFLHDRAWQTVYFTPQTHLLGKADRGILYLKRRVG